MLFKYTTTASPVALDVVKDLVAIMTGATDPGMLSSSCDKQASQLLDASHPSAWTKIDEPPSLTGVSGMRYIAVLQSPLLADGNSRAFVPWMFSSSTLYVYHPADGWNASTRQLMDTTGAEFNHSFDSTLKNTVITANAVQDFYVFVKNTTIVVSKRSADAANYPPLFCAEFQNIGHPKSITDLLPFVTGGVYAKSSAGLSFPTWITPARSMLQSETSKKRIWGNNQYGNNGYIAPPVGWEAASNTNAGGSSMKVFMTSQDAEAKAPFYPLWVWIGAWGVFGPLKDFPLYMLPWGFTASVGDTITGPDGTYMVFGCGNTSSRKTVMQIGA
ncbi:hypothetical protein [Thiofaba sp. EF100]|uniref:hypothetical protein n=1 Tax=Thiofaba sp. EF100 TaxID=3121274 RepID=UPI003221BD60